MLLNAAAVSDSGGHSALLVGKEAGPVAALGGSCSTALPSFLDWKTLDKWTWLCMLA